MKLHLLHAKPSDSAATQYVYGRRCERHSARNEKRIQRKDKAGRPESHKITSANILSVFIE